MSDPYDMLGVNKKASKSDIKKAYKRKAMALHPDRGGDEEEFKILKDAFECAMNGGKKKQPNNKHLEAMQELAGLFTQCIDRMGDRIFTIDIVSNIQGAITTQLAANKNEINKHEKAIEKLNKLLGKMSLKKGDNNLFEAVINQKLEEVNRQIFMVNQKNALIEDVIKLLADYEYDYEVQQQVDAFVTSAYFTTGA